MNQIKLEQIKTKVKQVLKPTRYEHTLGVMYTAGALAMRYHEDMYNALFAGLLHDCAKSFPESACFSLCNSFQIPVSDVERKNPGLLHAKLGARLAEREYGITDAYIMDAICYHTTGRPNMTLLDKIIYVADYMEPNRCEAPNLDEIRRLAFEDIDECLYAILESTMAYLKQKDAVIDPMTEETYLYYKKVLNK